jgi:Ca2+-binding RTX toxin-like protein
MGKPTIAQNEGKGDAMTRRSTQQGRKLGFQTLERRDLMAANFAAATTTTTLAATTPQSPRVPAAVTVSIENHDLVIRGTDGADDVKLTTKDGKIVVTVTTEVNGKAVPTSTSWRPTGGDVFFYGYKGNDKLTCAMSSGNYLRVTADGGAGNDTLRSNWGADALYGGAGDDTLFGHRGHDLLDGGLGADKIEGDDGNDTIHCGPDSARNTVFGGLGDDTITGGYGLDSLHGDAGNDTIDGSYGGDDIFGGDGDDILRAGNDSLRNYLDGGNGNDKLYGSYGGDRLFGRNGNDTLFGYAGNDKLDGGTGLDRLFGGDGDDELHSGRDDDQQDRMYGQAGRDTFYAEEAIGETWFPIDNFTSPSPEVRDAEAGVDTTIHV